MRDTLMQESFKVQSNFVFVVSLIYSGKDVVIVLCLLGDLCIANPDT